MVVRAIGVIAIVERGKLRVRHNEILGEQSARAKRAAVNDLTAWLDSPHICCVQGASNTCEVAIRDKGAEGRIAAQRLRSREVGTHNTASTLMLPDDEIAVVTFDNLVDTPVPMQQVNTAPDFSTIDINPRGATWIGGGIQQGAVQLAAATHSNRSMLVLTDGNENVHPFIK
jgi:hypothetical protein